MLDLVQLYNLGLSDGIDIFSGITLPAGSSMDVDTLKSVIMEKCGLNIPMYADPRIMKSAIDVWSAKNQYTFAHVNKLYEASYSPIENYDRFEDSRTDHNKDTYDKTNATSSKGETATANNNTSVSESKSSTHSGTDSTTETGTVSAENASTFQNSDQTTTDLVHGESISDTGSGTTTASGSSSRNTSGSNNTNRNIVDLEKTTENKHMHGNIGVTTAMSMEREEYELIGNYNPYNFLAGLFENELTLFVY